MFDVGERVVCVNASAEDYAVGDKGKISFKPRLVEREIYVVRRVFLPGSCEEFHLNGLVKKVIKVDFINCCVDVGVPGFRGVPAHGATRFRKLRNLDHQQALAEIRRWAEGLRVLS